VLGRVWTTALAALCVGAACSSDVGTSTAEDLDDAAELDAADPRLAATAQVFGDLDERGPGCAVAIRHADGVAEWQIGLADIERNDPIDADTVFDIGSVSKQITGGVVAALVLDGEIGLDDPVGEYISGLDAGLESATVADLVHHTSGLADYVDLLDADFEEVTDAGDALAAIRSSGPNFAPGTAFEYSNTNYFLLAQVSEVVSGQSFAELTDSLVFSPLGMEQSVVRDDQGELLDGQAVGYERTGTNWDPAMSRWRQTGDGAVHSTPLDLVRWSELFLTGDRAVDDGVVGSDEWIDVMLSTGDVEDDDGTGYGFGVSVGNGMVTHAGSWLGYSSWLGMRPSEGVAVALACNIDGLDAETLGLDVLEVWT
jgi:CubicO group peptidase (beta-lactamase class C family)